MMSEKRNSHFYERTTFINCEMCSLLPQGEFLWCDKDFRSLAVLGTGVAMAFFYFYFRDPGKEITWKHLEEYYLVRSRVKGLHNLSTRKAAMPVVVCSSVRLVS